MQYKYKPLEVPALHVGPGVHYLLYLPCIQGVLGVQLDQAVRLHQGGQDSLCLLLHLHESTHHGIIIQIPVQLHNDSRGDPGGPRGQNPLQGAGGYVGGGGVYTTFAATRCSTQLTTVRAFSILIFILKNCLCSCAASGGLLYPDRTCHAFEVWQ